MDKTFGQLSLAVAMEPGLGGQEKQRRRGESIVFYPVAMEPGLGGQEKPTCL